MPAGKRFRFGAGAALLFTTFEIYRIDCISDSKTLLNTKKNLRLQAEASGLEPAPHRFSLSVKTP